MKLTAVAAATSLCSAAFPIENDYHFQLRLIVICNCSRDQSATRQLKKQLRLATTMAA
jgi:hypothetical protein